MRKNLGSEQEIELDKSDKNKLIEYSPEKEHISKFVEKYQFYRFDSEYWIKTVPNARLEFWYILDGGFNIWDESSNSFREAPKIGGYPATNSSLLFHIPERLYCVNLKLHLRALSISLFRDLYPADPFCEISEKVFSHEKISEFTELIDIEYPDIVHLDYWADTLIGDAEPDPKIDQILSQLEIEEVETVKQWAKDLNYSPRNFQRLIKNIFDLTPKQLMSLVRFSETTINIKERLSKKLTDGLSSGYYDQSHFIRECKRITGVSPKELFEDMILSTPDLMVYNGN